MESNNFILKSGRGKNTILDKAYNKLVLEIRQSLNEETEERWETYNIIIEELLRLGKTKYFQEIKYRLTDKEDPNEVMLDIINRDLSSDDGFLMLLRDRIKGYIEDDFIKRFTE